MKLLSSIVTTGLLVSASIGQARPLGGFFLQKNEELVILNTQDSKIPGDSPFKLCDVEQPQLAHIEYIDISPNPPEKGTQLNITAAGTLDKTIDSGAYVEVDVRYGYIRLLKQKFDLCEQIHNVDMDCPVEQGYLEVAKSVDLPNEIPPGKYLVIARAFTAEDELLTCLTAAVEFPAIYQ